MKKYVLLTIAVVMGGVVAGVALMRQGEPQGALPVYAAQADYFLKIKGIDGEAMDDRHKGEIEVESWSWGMTQSGAARVGGGGGAGKVQVHDFSFVKKIDKASPALMLACASGKHYPEAVLAARAAGGDQQDYYKIVLSDVVCSSLKQGGSMTEVPTDQVSLNFAKIQVEYMGQTATGAAGVSAKAGWNVKLNKKE